MRERWPMLGLVMIILGVLNVVTSVIQLAFNVGNAIIETAAVQDLPQSEALAQLLSAGGAVVMVGFWVLCGVLWVVAGLLLRRRRGRGLAICALVMGLIPCCTANFLCTGAFNFAAAIFGLMVLAQRDEDEGFYR